ncbi:hypothetical protein Ga0609869_000067 [Rhodovulum iodosum]|uniref:Uncharacterized protein n=1 Tax=Rhodovulum iodosum TaxID=68291 RepID=A0ABV3XND4_9RHOB|nr:hypothetical protein [Rhodovulum robiginosum]RSK35851.1 hypothetical protein EJA01_05760 [Rhodovulum robiginosum]
MRLEMADPKGLIRESYRIEGIGAEECRSIFLDWALSLPAGTATDRALKRLIAEYSPVAPDHPMTGVLREGLASAPTPRRRGGAGGRRS